MKDQHSPSSPLLRFARGPGFRRSCLVLLALLLPGLAMAQSWGLQVRSAPGVAGVEVTAVGTDSAAGSADVRVGDVIVQAQGKPVATPEQFALAAQGVPAGGNLTLVVSRQGWERTLSLKAPSAPMSFGMTLRESAAAKVPEVAAVVPNGAAANAGLEPGDLIVRAEGISQADVAALQRLLADYAVQARPLDLTVQRKDWVKQVRIVPVPVRLGAQERDAGARSMAPGATTPMPPAGSVAVAPPPARTSSPPPPALPPVVTMPLVIGSGGDAVADLVQGNLQYERGNWREAEIAYKQALQSVPNEPRMWGRLCHAQVMQERFVEALETCKRAAQLAPSEASVFQNIGYSHSRLLQYAEAIGWYQRAIEVAPDWPPPYAGIGGAYLALRNWAKAEEYYKLVVVRDPRNQAAWRSLGDATGELGKSADAIANYRKVLDLGPADAALHRGLGWHLYREDRLIEAEAALIEAKRLNASDINTLLLLGSVTDKLGKAAEAQDAWQRAADLEPDGPLGAIARQNLVSLKARQALGGSATARPATTAPQSAAAKPEAPSAPRPPETPAEQPRAIVDPEFETTN